MHETHSVTEVARSFADYINRVVYRGEHFILTRGNKPVAELAPLPTGTTGKHLEELPGLLSSLPSLSEDEASEFADGLTEARAALSSTHVRDPWASS